MKIRDCITTGREAKMILMAPFLFFLSFSSPAFLPHSWDTAEYRTCPAGVGLALLLEAQTLSGAQGRSWMLSTVPGLLCHGSAELLPRAGDTQEVPSGPAQPSLYLQKPHPEFLSSFLAVCHFPRKTSLL